MFKSLLGHNLPLPLVLIIGLWQLPKDGMNPIRSPTGPFQKFGIAGAMISYIHAYRPQAQSRAKLWVLNCPTFKTAGAKHAQRPVANKGSAAYVPPGLGKTYGPEDFGLLGWIQRQHRTFVDKVAAQKSYNSFSSSIIQFLSSSYILINESCLLQVKFC